jgi:hypothetical protein
VIEETIFDALDLDRKNDPDLNLMTSTQLLIELGFKTPTNQQCREVNSKRSFNSACHRSLKE